MALDIVKTYKKTEIGSIPTDWEVVKLGRFIRSLNAGVSVNSYDRPANNSQLGILKTSAVNNGVFNPNENKLIKENEIERAKINPLKDSIIISRMNTPDLVGEVGYVDNTYKNLYLPDRLWQTEYNEKVSGRWLASLLTLWEFKRQLKNIATGTSNSMKNISKKAFLSLKVPKPSYCEQQKISDILSNWDKAIHLKEKLIEQKIEQKKGLMQKLFTGKGRLPGYKGEFKKKKLKSLIKEIKIKNKDQKVSKVLSVTNTRGFIEQGEHFGKRVASENISTYKIVKKGQFAYNPSRVNVGSIDRLSSFKEGLLSPMYVIFESDEKKLFPGYLEQFIRSYEFYERMKGLLEGSVRQSLSFNSLEQMVITMPGNIEEQKAIYELLTKADQEIILLENEIYHLSQQKKGLMQLLLRGKVRVMV